MRAARRGLGADERATAAAAAAANLVRLGFPGPRTRVAAYLPIDCELDPGPAAALARARGCTVYAPVITSFGQRRMRFAELSPRMGTRRNRWGIDEPSGSGVDGRWLDLALVPCVAFDETGARLGLGAGFYDRHFAFLKCRTAWHRPRLIGLAYDFQRLPRLEQRPWDVPLWGVVTDRGVYGPASAFARPAPGEDAP
jgi:5-formyltetrahydrofolate cyclo-ligase